MERFDFAPNGPKPFTLVFPHIPKTGGTTLLYHFRRNLGDRAILSYGQHNRIVRFFANQPQFEEMDAGQIDALHVIQGHAVSDAVLMRMGDAPAKLIVVLRHPVGLTRSRFNQRFVSMAQRGIEVTSDAFMEGEPEDFIASLLLQKFPAFVDPDAASKRDRVISVLRKFDYVLTTERLDDQVCGLMDDMGLPQGLERRRVAEKKAELAVSEADILARNALDLDLFETANAIVPAPGHHNAFGFDAAGQAKVIAGLAARGAEPTTNIYDALTGALCQTLRAEAALAKLDAGGAVAIGDVEAFHSLLAEKWQRLKPTLSEKRTAISNEWLERWHANPR